MSRNKSDQARRAADAPAGSDTPPAAANVADQTAGPPATAATVPGFGPQERTFDDTMVFLGSPSMGVTLNGVVCITAQGEMSGSVKASFPDGTVARIDTSADALRVCVGDTTLDLQPDNDETVAFNGRPVSLDSLGELVPFVMGEQPAGKMPAEAQALYALMAFAATPEFIRNAEIAAVLGISINWCKVTVGTAAAILAGLIAAGCTGICTAGTVVTLGGLAIPCAAIVAFCAGAGAAAGYAAAYNFLLGYWNP